MNKFLNKLKKKLFLTHFWSIFPNLEAENFFQENPTLSHTTSNSFFSTIPKFKKTNDAIPRKQPDRREDRETEGQKDIRMDRPYFKGPVWQ